MQLIAYFRLRLFFTQLILSLPHCHRHIAIYVAQVVYTIIGRMCLLVLRDLHFTLHFTLWFHNSSIAVISDKLSKM